MTVRTEVRDDVLEVTLDRSSRRNAVDGATAEKLLSAFEDFEADHQLRVAILAGAGNTFCSGADLKAISEGNGNRVELEGPGPMGPTRLVLSKPVIAAIEGHAVAGGLELALWCDLRVVASDAVLGVFCRRWGVPLVDGGTVRLPRLIGGSRAADLILTGRAVGGEEAMSIGLANRLTAPGEALATARLLARELAALPPICMRSDLRSSRDQWDLPVVAALRHETELGRGTLSSGESRDGAARFTEGAGRGGAAAP